MQLKYFAIFALVGGGLSSLWGFVILAVIHQSDVQHGLATEGSSLIHAGDGLFWWFVLAVLLLSALVGLSGVLVTHRIAGPVFVMGRAMEQLTAGKYPRLRGLRDSDDLTDFYSTFRTLLAALLQTDRDDLATIDKALALISSSDGPNSAAARGILIEMQMKKSEKMSSMGDDGRRSTIGAP